MSNETKDGGHAFACAAGTPGNGDWQSGMSLRDYFAGQALDQASREVWADHKPEDIARRCYRLADAMLAERVKGEES